MGVRTLILASTLGFAAVAQADEPADLLLRISEAARTQNYQGVVIYRGDDLLETFRVAHRYDNGDERERVQSLTGEVREILKHDDKVICILPKDQQMTVNLPTPKGLFPGLDAALIQQLAKVYELRLLGEARVAGRRCLGLAVSPRDQFRYGYVIWADAETRVPLKVSLIGQNGRALEQMFFTEVEFPARIPDSAFQTAFDPETMRKVTQSSAGAISRAAAEVVAANPALVKARDDEMPVPAMPPGFKVTMRDVRELPDQRGIIEHVVLSDGLSAISVFRSRQVVSSQPGFAGLSQMGAVNAYGRVVGRTQITVVGEAPPETVRMIGDSFDLSPETVADDGQPSESWPVPERDMAVGAGAPPSP